MFRKSVALSKQATKPLVNVIIGLGPAGLAAALVASKKDVKARKIIVIT